MHRPAGELSLEIVTSFKWAEHIRNGGNHGLKTLLRHAAPIETLGETDDADRKRRPRGNGFISRKAPAGPAPACPFSRQIEADDFRRPAADIKHEDIIHIRIDQRGAAGDREARLVFRTEDLDIKATALSHSRDKLVAIPGHAARFRCNKPCALHVVALKLASANFEGINRPQHGRFRKVPMLPKSFTQSYDARKSIDHAKPAPRWPRQQQAAIVGAKVQRTINAIGGRHGPIWPGRRGTLREVGQLRHANLMRPPLRSQAAHCGRPLDHELYSHRVSRAWHGSRALTSSGGGDHQACFWTKLSDYLIRSCWYVKSCRLPGLTGLSNVLGHAVECRSDVFSFEDALVRAFDCARGP